MNKTLTGLALAALALSPTLAQAQRPSAYLVVPLYRSGTGGGGDAAPQVSNDPEFWVQEKQRALERLELAVQEKVECRTKYATPSFIRDCETSAETWRGYWNERALSASREYDRLTAK